MCADGIFVYSKLGFDWGTLALFFLTPDVSFLGYVAGPRIGAVTYNTAHSYVGAIAGVVAGFLLLGPLLLCAGVIWCAHIGFDRALGYGLKYRTGFESTHLGLFGQRAKSAPNIAANSDSLKRHIPELAEK